MVLSSSVLLWVGMLAAIGSALGGGAELAKSMMPCAAARDTDRRSWRHRGSVAEAMAHGNVAARVTLR